MNTESYFLSEASIIPEGKIRAVFQATVLCTSIDEGSPQVKFRQSQLIFFLGGLNEPACIFLFFLHFGLCVIN